MSAREGDGRMEGKGKGFAGPMSNCFLRASKRAWFERRRSFDDQFDQSSNVCSVHTVGLGPYIHANLYSAKDRENEFQVMVQRSENGPNLRNAVTSSVPDERKRV